MISSALGRDAETAEIFATEALRHRDVLSNSSVPPCLCGFVLPQSRISGGPYRLIKGLGCRILRYRDVPLRPMLVVLA